MTIEAETGRAREPIFNLPRVVSASLGVLALIHAVRLALPAETDLWLLLLFSFVPARYSGGVGDILPGGEAAEAWTVFTYALLHGDLAHLLVNSVWLAAFGSALAWRFGPARFLVFSAVCTAGGAMAHLASHWGEMVPVVGASAAISGHMAAVSRYAFRGGVAGALGRRDPSAFRRPAQGLGEVLRDPRVFAFLAVWFGLNIVFGTGIVALSPDSGQIAWQAHIGGFLAGLVLFPLFDPVPRDMPPANSDWLDLPADPEERAGHVPGGDDGTSYRP